MNVLPSGLRLALWVACCCSLNASAGCTAAPVPGALYYYWSAVVFFGTVEAADDQELLRVRVVEPFKGVKAGQVVEVQRSVDDCSPAYAPGDQRMFYAARDGKGLRALAGVTLNLEEDLLFLRGLPVSSGRNRLAGMVTGTAGEPVLIHIKPSKGTSRRIATNRDGTFELYDLEPGEYTLLVEPPAKVTASRIAAYGISQAAAVAVPPVVRMERDSLVSVRIECARK
ncbi:hypothetical protein F183_A04620 [Bryobacterales bacterium F-183]|nr:hypothetical protein F183_A04620 [Bryobacterales bacterium F-183]